MHANSATCYYAFYLAMFDKAHVWYYHRIGSAFFEILHAYIFRL